MAFKDTTELLSEARSFFIEGHYKQAENLLDILVLERHQNPEIYQMLATIAYERGSFKKAIGFFNRALEIDPAYTDASIGLSILHNDLGQYEEGKAIFLDAQKALKKPSEPKVGTTSSLEPEKNIAQENLFGSTSAIKAGIKNKQLELVEMYLEARQYDEAEALINKMLLQDPEDEQAMKHLEKIHKLQNSHLLKSRFQGDSSPFI
jgi:tetratricopeptide (TPR) repeat protein